MATAQNKWYSLSRAKIKRFQAQHPCDLLPMHPIMGIGGGKNNILALRLTLSRPLPHEPGHTETFSLELEPEELEKIWFAYLELKRVIATTII